MTDTQSRFDTKRMRACAPLLPEPGDRIVLECLDEIERLSAALAEARAAPAVSAGPVALPADLADALAELHAAMGTPTTQGNIGDSPYLGVVKLAAKRISEPVSVEASQQQADEVSEEYTAGYLAGWRSAKRGDSEPPASQQHVCEAEPDSVGRDDADYMIDSLCLWLRQNSAGIYRNASTAADVIEYQRDELSRLTAELDESRRELSSMRCDCLALESRESKLLAELSAAKAEAEALRKDAERYRTWRHAFREGECDFYNAICNAESEAEHDAAIDAAIAAQQGEKP